MIGRRNILAMLGLAPAAMASGAVPLNPAPPGSYGMGSVGSSLSGASIVRDAFSDHDELDRRKKRLAAKKHLHALGYREDRHLYSRCECIESRRATSPAVKQLLQQERQDRMEIEREQINVDNHVLRMLMPQGLREWL